MMDILYGTIMLLLYSHLNSLNIKICLQRLRYFFNSIFGCQGGSGATCKWSYHVGHFDMVVQTPLKPKMFSLGMTLSTVVEYSLFLFFVSRETVALHVNDPIITDTSIWSFRELEHQNLSLNSWDNVLVPFLVTKEAMVPLANNIFISATLIRFFKHLKHQNLSTGDDFISSSGLILLVQFLATREFLSCWALWYGLLDTLNIKICPLFIY